MLKYKTISGDTWDMIAYKVYGDCKYISKLMEANIDKIETVIFSANIEINCPELVDTQATDKLPPWKR